MNSGNLDNECLDEDRTSWAGRDASPVVSEAAAVGRMQKILDLLIGETWLPFGLRTLVAEEISTMRDQLATALIGLGSAGERVHSLALATFAYRELMWESETVAQLRVLDLELNPGVLGPSGTDLS